MFDNFNKKLIILSKSIDKLLKEKMTELKMRNKKTNLNDGILFKLLTCVKDSTHLKSAAIINNYNYINISAQSYYNRISNLKIDFYRDLSNFITNKINKLFYKKNQYNILSVDGTYAQFKSSVNEEKLNPNENSTTNLITGIYNVTHNCPELLQLENKRTERSSIVEIIKNKYNNTSTIFVMDRGYMSSVLFSSIHSMNNYFICRLRKNLIINENIDKNLTDYEIDYSSQILPKMRIIKYTINDKPYYIGTNLFDKETFTKKYIEDIYHKRWSVEEYFKIIKGNTNMKQNDEEIYDNVEKTVICYDILMKLEYLLKNYYESNKSPKKIPKHEKPDKCNICNKSFLFSQLYTTGFLLKLFYGELDNNFINFFIDNSFKYVASNRNINNDRTCKRSNFLFYYKNNSINRKNINKIKNNLNDNDKTDVIRKTIKRKTKNSRTNDKITRNDISFEIDFTDC
jgi:hypothetical protein